MSTANNVSGYTVNSATASTLNNTTQSAQQLKDEFLTLMMAQLKNQDPTQPVDSTQMLAQEAQFSSLEQMQNLNSNFVSMMAMQNVNQATNLLGRTVSGTSNGVAATGVVQGVSFSSGTPVLNVNVNGVASPMNLSDITSVS